MNIYLKRCSVIANGSETYEFFETTAGRFCQYDYRTVDGRLFSTIAPTLELARKKRDEWLADIYKEQQTADSEYKNTEQIKLQSSGI